MITATLNKSGVSLSARLREKLDEAIEDKKPEIENSLIEIAGTLTALSPVWSGAYVTSHSFVPKGSGGGRSRTSYRENGPVDVRMAQDIGFEQLVSDIRNSDFIESGGGVFRNRSPHARGVEDGGVTKSGTIIQAHAVYRTTKRYHSG